MEKGVSQKRKVLTPKSRCVTRQSILLGITSVNATRLPISLAASDFPKFLLSYFQRLDDDPIESVQLPLEAAVLPPTTILFPYINCHVLARRLKRQEELECESKKTTDIPSTSLGHRCPYMHFTSSQSLPNLQGVIRLTYLSVASSFLLGL